MYNALKAVIATLETIHVSGKNNLDKLLGCILTVEKICNEMEKVVAEGDSNGERENNEN